MSDDLDALAAATCFSGVARADHAGTVVLERAYGLAHRGFGIPSAPDTRFGVASLVKGLTAVTVLALVEEGRLGLATPARELLGTDLPLIDDAVTVEHLLRHRSGIGDYLDESGDWDPADYVLPVPVHRLATAEDYLAVLDGHPQAFPPGERFAYNNGGFVVLALLAERASAMPFHALVDERVCRPAGMRDTAFDRSDEPGPRTALGYLEPEGLRTNLLHLPVRGSGDGGLVTTAADLRAFWTALSGGRLLRPDTVAALTVPHPGDPYGLGFWLVPGGLMLEGSDAGISCRSLHDAARDVTVTVLANTSAGAWRVSEHLAGCPPWSTASSAPRA
jgi:CubicO group peptidase (beta-lactamase class C family)